MYETEFNTGIKCSKCSLWILAWSLIIIIFTTIIRGVVGVICGSSALIASAIYSFADCITFGINYASAQNKKTDAVWLSTLISILIFLFAVWICADNIIVLISGKMAHPGLLALFVAVIFSVLNWYFYRISICTDANNKDDKNVLLCRLLNRSNFFCSCLASAGILFAEYDFLFLDPVSGIIIGCVMIKESFEIFELTALTRYTKKFALLSTGILSCFIIGFYTYIAVGIFNSRAMVLIPSQGMQPENQIDSVLGRAQYFIIINTKDNTFKPVFNSCRYLKSDVSNAFLAIVKENKVGVVLAKNIGTEMFYDLRSAGIKMYYIDIQGNVIDILASYRNGQFKLAVGPNVDKGFGRAQIRWLAPW